MPLLIAFRGRPAKRRRRLAIGLKPRFYAPSVKSVATSWWSATRSGGAIAMSLVSLPASGLISGHWLGNLLASEDAIR